MLLTLGAVHPARPAPDDPLGLQMRALDLRDKGKFAIYLSVS
ncbi:hypothetical protein [Sphingomonas sp. GM_Shp_2]|nr:hypothetical protein [Sphingomonas sp. GM_Shp_2]